MYRLNSLNADIQLIVDGAWESAWESSSSAVSKKGERDYLRIQAMTLQESC